MLLGVTTQGLNHLETLNLLTLKQPTLFTRELLLSDVPLVDIGGSLYREFLLDINEAASDNKKLLSLDELQFYLFNAPDVNDIDILTANADQLYGVLMTQ